MTIGRATPMEEETKLRLDGDGDAAVDVRRVSSAIGTSSTGMDGAVTENGDAGAMSSSSAVVDRAFAAIGRGTVGLAAASAVALAVSGGVGGGWADGGFSGAASAPTGACGALSSERLRVARDVMMCNQENWREKCLANYDDEGGAFSYVDGPGLTKVRGKPAMERYLRNQFDFSRQYLSVEEEVCEADSYVATWSLDMLLGTGPLRNVQGISVLKFKPGSDKIVYHRDFLPDGPIWENAPIVGPLVKLQRQTYTSCMQSDVGCAKILGGVER